MVVQSANAPRGSLGMPFLKDLKALISSSLLCFASEKPDNKKRVKIKIVSESDVIVEEDIDLRGHVLDVKRPRRNI